MEESFTPGTIAPTGTAVGGRRCVVGGGRQAVGGGRCAVGGARCAVGGARSVIQTTHNANAHLDAVLSAALALGICI